MRGIPSPFIKIYERGWDTPYPSPHPLLPKRKDFLDEGLASLRQAAASPDDNILARGICAVMTVPPEPELLTSQLPPSALIR